MSSPVSTIPFSRRGALRSLGALAGLSLPYRLGHGDSSLRLGAGDRSQTRPIICIFLDGGLSQFESFDPKPNAPAEIRGQFNPIETCTPGVHFSELWPQLAKQSGLLTVLRSVSHKQNDHAFAVRCMETLNQQGNDQTPSLGSVVQWQSQSNLPVYVSIPRIRDTGGTLGASCQPWDLKGALAKRVTQRRDETLSHRLKRLHTLQALSQYRDQTSALVIEQQHKVSTILQSSRFQKMLDLSSTSDKTWNQYGRSKAGEFAILARNAVQSGMKYVVIELGSWDMHMDLFARMQTEVPVVDQAISALISDLADQGLLRETVVMVMTEFGRTPHIVPRHNKPGRDHWPNAMSLLLAGGTIPGGQVVGDTGRHGEMSEAIHHSPEDLSASLYNWLQLDRDLLLPNDEGLLNVSGTPIPELNL